MKVIKTFRPGCYVYKIENGCCDEMKLYKESIFIDEDTGVITLKLYREADWNTEEDDFIEVSINKCPFCCKPFEIIDKTYEREDATNA